MLGRVYFEELYRGYRSAGSQSRSRVLFYIPFTFDLFTNNRLSSQIRKVNEQVWEWRYR